MYSVTAIEKVNFNQAKLPAATVCIVLSKATRLEFKRSTRNYKSSTRNYNLLPLTEKL